MGSLGKPIGNTKKNPTLARFIRHCKDLKSTFAGTCVAIHPLPVAIDTSIAKIKWTQAGYEMYKSVYKINVRPMKY